MSVARIIDQLTDGMVDLFVYVIQVVQNSTNSMRSLLRLIGLHSDVNDAHRAGANRLKNKKKTFTESHAETVETFEIECGNRRFLLPVHVQ